MKTFARTIDLKDDPDVIARYVEYHRDAWPEVERGLIAIGIERMRIWLLGRRLFMLMETSDDFDETRDFARDMEMDPRIREWQSLMDAMQDPVPERREGEWWADMRLVFDLAREEKMEDGI
jgi:L-rhamnose mutarotase